MSEAAEQPVNVEKVQQEYKRKTIMEHLVGPFGSVLFHILIVFAAINLMVFTQTERAPEIEVMMTTPETVDLEDFNKELEKMDEIQEMSDVVTPTDVQVSVDTPTAVDQQAVGPSEDVSTDLSQLNMMNDMSGPLVMKGLFAGRSAGGRASALGQYGGDARTENAVLKALEWLKNHQAANGSWGAGGGDNQVGVTGLGLLTFLAHGETTASAKYGPTVEKAIRFLVSKQQENGVIGGLQPGKCADGGDGSSYAHGIATYAISEAYGITRIPSLKQTMEKAVAIIIQGQQDGGGWDYRFCKGPRKDTSVAGWQVQALKAAYIAGAETPGIKEALAKAAVYMKAMQNAETGQIGYSNPGSGNPPITAVGVLCLQLIGHAEDKEVDKGLQFMRGWDLKWDKPGFNAPMYGWYYITQAKFHKGGADWQSWNQDLRRELPASQKEDGHWEFPAEEHGSGAGPAYSTTLAALSLQVYYRFLPTYKPIAVEKKTEEKTEEVSIEII